MTPSRAWTEDNLISCLLQCLKLMVKWLESGNCPNNFVNDQNLFVKAEFSRRIKNRLLHEIRILVNKDTQFVSMLKSDNIRELMSREDCRRYREPPAVKVNKYTAELKIMCAKFIICYNSTALSIHSHDPVNLASTLDNLQRTESINKHTIEVTQSSLAYLYPWLHLHIAKGLTSLTYRYPDAGNHQQLMEMADFHFNEASDADLVNMRLARATVMFKAGRFEECFQMLQLVENEFIHHVTLICPCTGICTIPGYGEPEEQIQNRKLSELPLRRMIRSMTASCVVFQPSQLEITPAPLQYEMSRSQGTLPGSRDEKRHFWFDWAVVDPKIYLCFMQYHVSSRLNKEPYKQVAFDNLRAEIVVDDRHSLDHGRGQLVHKDTAYNLLGWIHAQEGRPVDAWRCFSESWKIRPYHNAAKFHMRDFCEVLKYVLQRALMHLKDRR